MVRFVALHVLLACRVPFLIAASTVTWSLDSDDDCNSPGACPSERAEALLQMAARRKGSSTSIPMQDVPLGLAEENAPVKFSGEIESASYSGLLSVSSPNGSQKAFKVMGIHHSGTHLLHEVLMNGLGVPYYVNEPYMREDMRSSEFCAFWKHASLSNLLQKAPDRFGGCSKEIFGLAIIRDPLAWLQSLRAAPFDFGFCTTGADWTNRSCKVNQTSEIIMSELSDFESPNIEAVWSSWSKDYATLDKFPFAQTFLVRYEDLVYDAGKVLQDIATRTNLTVNLTANLIADQATLARKREEISQRSYLRGYSEFELRQVCERLDIELMRAFGYMDCDDILNGTR